MKFFIDTANVEDIRKANDMGVICGVTTNPSLIAKEGRDFNQVIAEIASIVDGPISGEVKATTTDAEGKYTVSAVDIPATEAGTFFLEDDKGNIVAETKVTEANDGKFTSETKVIDAEKVEIGQGATVSVNGTEITGDDATIENGVITTKPVAPPEPLGLTVEAATGTVLNKEVSALQTEFSLGEMDPKTNTWTASGTSNYVSGWTDFSSKPAQQEGNYVALKFASAEGAQISANGVTLDEDGIFVVILDGSFEYKCNVTVTKGDVTEEYVVDLSKVTRAAKPDVTPEVTGLEAFKDYTNIATIVIEQLKATVTVSKDWTPDATSNSDMIGGTSTGGVDQSDQMFVGLKIKITADKDAAKTDYGFIVNDGQTVNKFSDGAPADGYLLLWVTVAKKSNDAWAAHVDTPAEGGDTLKIVKIVENGENIEMGTITVLPILETGDTN